MGRRKLTRHLLWTAFVVGELAIVFGTATYGHAHPFRFASHRLAFADIRQFVPLVRNGGVSAPDSRPSWGAPLAVSPHDGSLWVANPDADTVSVVDPDQLALIAEIPVGREPWSLVIAPSGREVHVVERASGTLTVIDSALYRVRATVSVGPEPGAVALSPTGATAFVTISSSNEVVAVDVATLTVTGHIPTKPSPYAVAISDDGDDDDQDEHVYVTHLLAMRRPGGLEASDDGHEGHVTVIDAGTQRVAKELSLAADVHGFPNVLSSIALTGSRAWIPHVRAAPALPNGLTTSVFAAVAAVDLATGQEDAPARIMLNDELTFGSPVNNPIAAIPSPDGTLLYVVLAGSDLVEIVDVTRPNQPRLVKFLQVGTNPRGIALSPDGQYGYVMNYLSRSVTVLDLERQKVVGDVAVTKETLEAPILRGKVLFNSAINPQVARASWISCASCHADGGTDGVTWMFPDGPRQTPPLWNAGRTLPWHWSAALDEPQDVEDTIHVIQQGLGLAPGPDPPLLGAPNAGRSADLDALAAYLTRGIRVPAMPDAQPNVAQGRELFVAAGCIACHVGPEWTVSSRPGAAGGLDSDGNGMVDPVLRDVGTGTDRDLRGATGFDVPSLISVGLSAPYLHDGSIADLPALLASGHPDPQGHGTVLTANEITALVAFLRSIGPHTPPLER